MNTTNNGLRNALMGALLALAAIATPAQAQAQDFTNAAYIQAGNTPTSVPIGHAEFCKTRPQECGPNKQVVEAVTLDERLWGELLNINAYVNQTVAPVTDDQLYKVEEFWTYPNGYGDCEDYVLAKRRYLIDAGWPASTLLISVVKQLSGAGHAVLVVRTDRGDFVLDNQVGSVDLWSDTPYVYIKRQSQANAGQWVDMVETRDVVTITAAIK